MTWDGNERRRHKRYAVRDDALQFTPAGWRAFWGRPSPKCAVINVSEGGGCFLCRQPPLAEARIDVSLKAEPLEKPVTLPARVVWTMPSKEEEAHRVGIAFDLGRISGASGLGLRRILDSCILESTDRATSIFIRKMDRM
jgi:hypothetical protein